MEGHAFSPEDIALSRDMYLLQVLKNIIIGTIYLYIHYIVYGNDLSLQYNLVPLQLCNGIDETTTGGCAQLVFAPIDESFGDDAPLLPSGFRVIPLEPKSVECYFLISYFIRLWLNSINLVLIY